MGESDPGPAFEMHIERGKIREFAAAMQSDAVEYQGADAVIPPTFLATYVQWAPPLARAGHGFDRPRVLHGEQEYVFHGPLPRAGQTLTVTERVAQRYEKAGRRGGVMRFAVLVAEFRSAAGELVAESRATVIERAVPTEEAQ